jgi:SAM-dependent methyltransferase
LHVFRPRHLLMAELIDRHLSGRRETIADIGCHNGFFLRLASHLGFRRLIAIDYFELPPARSFLRGLGGAEFHRTNFNEAGFLRDLPDGGVDCVSSTEVVEHLFNHPLGYLLECWRVLRPGGVLALTTPNPATLVNSLRLLAGRSIQWGAVAFAETVKVTPDGLPAAMWDIHFREYLAAELEEVLKKLPGSRVIESGFVGTGPDPSSAATKRWGKSLQWRLGLGRCRPLCTTQYWLLRKGDAES